MILNGIAGFSSPITSNDSNSGDKESGVKELAISELGTTCVTVEVIHSGSGTETVSSLGIITTSFPAMSVTVSGVRNN